MKHGSHDGVWLSLVPRMQCQQDFDDFASWRRDSERDADMKMARVIGNLWATHKEARLTGLRFLVVQPVNHLSEAEGEMIVAVDPLGAGIGQNVLLVEGSTAARALRNSELPVDAAVVAIVDKLEVESS